jgi:hypothetical protein
MVSQDEMLSLLDRLLCKRGWNGWLMNYLQWMKISSWLCDYRKKSASSTHSDLRLRIQIT